MIVAIKASKMFKSSTRQQRILAAMQDPINVELVQQLDRYIPDNLPKDSNESSDNELSDSRLHRSKGSSSSEHSRGPSNSLHPATFHQVDDTDESSDTSELENSDTAESEGSDVSGDNSQEDPILNSASAIHRRQVAGQRKYNILQGDIQILLGTLNSRDDTAGVSRISVEKNESSESRELWIYYIDTVNLNNVMTLVIDVVSRSYPEFIFNRLARSSNAVVFDMCQPTAISAVAQS